ncbi:retrotransposon protein, putative, ty1-copia subclass [Tanacetum coccineum]|uniref:Retrotransposon protein, putative, ty1-copia subclass n=1 Tax=Tanacetum coccineum TaxID=301880 RepID=A0ABQ5C0U0_9ASTR
MAGIKSMVVMVVLVVLASFQLQSTLAQTRHVVGDSIGWTIPTNGAGAYTTWAASQTFRVAPLQPISTETNGPATITLRTAGNHYYICAFGTHCQAGQKVTVKRLLAVPTHTHPASTSRAPAGSPPSTPDATTSPPPPSPSSQIATLTKELQSAKASVWTRYGSGNSDQGIPRSMRLDVRAFPDTRKFAIKEYFELFETTPKQRLRIIGFNLEGDNAKWYRCMTRNKLATSWDGFLENVRNRFGLSKYEDPQGALSKLFENRYGLKPALQRELTVTKPTTLCEAFSLARKILLLLAEEENDIGADNTTEEDEVVESGDISILNSLIDTEVRGLSNYGERWGQVGYAPTPMCSGTAGVRGAEKWDFLGQMRQACQAVAIIEKYLQVWLEFKNSLKHKRKKISVEDLVARLGIEEDKKLAQKNTYTPDYAKDNMVEHAGSSSKSNSKAKGKGKGKNDEKGKGNADVNLIGFAHRSKLYMGNSATADIKGEGDVILKMTFEKELKLTNVLDVLERFARILCPCWLFLKKFGFRLVFKSDKFVLSKNKMYFGKGYALNGGEYVVFFACAVCKTMNQTRVHCSLFTLAKWYCQKEVPYLERNGYAMLGDAILTATYLLNKIPRKEKEVTPYEPWMGRKPSDKYLLVWGCLAKVVVPTPKAQKIGPKSVDCILIGYVKNSSAYRFIVHDSKNPDIQKNTVMESINATFFENIFPCLTKETRSSFRIDEEIVQDKRHQDDNDLQDKRKDQPEEKEVEPRRSKRVRTEKSFGPDFVSLMVDNEPTSYREAITSLEEP